MEEKRPEPARRASSASSTRNGWPLAKIRNATKHMKLLSSVSSPLPNSLEATLWQRRLLPLAGAAAGRSGRERSGLGAGTTADGGGLQAAAAEMAKVVFRVSSHGQVHAKLIPEGLAAVLAASKSYADFVAAVGGLPELSKGAAKLAEDEEVADAEAVDVSDEEGVDVPVHKYLPRPRKYFRVVGKHPDPFGAPQQSRRRRSRSRRATWRTRRRCGGTRRR